LIAIASATTHGALKLPNRLTERAADFRKPACAKQQQHDGKYDDKLTPTYVHISPRIANCEFRIAN